MLSLAIITGMRALQVPLAGADGCFVPVRLATSNVEPAALLACSLPCTLLTLSSSVADAVRAAVAVNVPTFAIPI